MKTAKKKAPKKAAAKKSVAKSKPRKAAPKKAASKKKASKKAAPKPGRSTPAYIRHCVVGIVSSQMSKTGNIPTRQDVSRAFRIAWGNAQKYGYVIPGTMKFTAKGKAKEAEHKKRKQRGGKDFYESILAEAREGRPRRKNPSEFSDVAKQHLDDLRRGASSLWDRAKPGVYDAADRGGEFLGRTAKTVGRGAAITARGASKLAARHGASFLSGASRHLDEYGHSQSDDYRSYDREPWRESARGAPPPSPWSAPRHASPPPGPWSAPRYAAPPRDRDDRPSYDDGSYVGGSRGRRSVASIRNNPSDDMLESLADVDIIMVDRPWCGEGVQTVATVIDGKIIVTNCSDYDDVYFFRDGTLIAALGINRRDEYLSFALFDLAQAPSADSYDDSVDLSEEDRGLTESHFIHGTELRSVIGRDGLSDDPQRIANQLMGMIA